MKEKETRCIIIPENILYCKKLPANAKLLYCTILDLCCNDKSYCWASNSYFAELYKVSNNSISSWIKSLQKNGFIKCNVMKNNTRQIFLVGDVQKYVEGVTRKLGHIIKGQETLSGNSPAPKDDFKVETKEWKDNKGHKHGQDSIDYES